MEKWLDNLMEFREEDFDEKDDFFFAMTDIGKRNQKLKVTYQELINDNGRSFLFPFNIVLSYLHTCKTIIII